MRNEEAQMDWVTLAVEFTKSEQAAAIYTQFGIVEDQEWALTGSVKRRFWETWDKAMKEFVTARRIEAGVDPETGR